MFNSEVKVAKPISNVLNKINKSTTEMRMSIRPSTAASQKSTNSSFIELSFNANVDHYVCYQWTRAIEVNHLISCNNFFETCPEKLNFKLVHKFL